MEEHWEITVDGTLSLMRDDGDDGPLGVGDEVTTKEGLRGYVKEITQPAKLNFPGKLVVTPYREG